MQLTNAQIATSLKSPKFLNFFFRQVRQNETDEHPEYRFFSPCGKEKNYIRAADTPVVFHTLEDHDPDNAELVYAGDLRVPFHPAQLFMSDTGKMYHPVEHKHLKGLALIKSHVAVQLSMCVEFADEVDASTGDVGNDVDAEVGAIIERGGNVVVRPEDNDLKATGHKFIWQGQSYDIWRAPTVSSS